jgi:hypothetical protein
MNVMPTSKLLRSLSIVTACVAQCVFPLSARSADTQGRVLEIATYKPYGNTVFIRMDTAQSPSGCSTNGYWHYTLPMNSDADKRTFAMLVTMQITAKPVYLYGAGVCSELADVESALGIRMLP